MSKTFMIAAKLILLYGILHCLLYSQPKFHVVGGNEFDFGDVLSFTPAKRILIIKNLGTETLTLSNIDASCGCTATLLSNDHIAPNDSSTLTITFNSKQFAGKVHKAVSIVTNDTTNRAIDIKFTANVLRILEIEPEYLFIRTAIDSTGYQNTVIKNVGSDTIKILSVISTSNLITTKLTKDIIKPSEETTLSATFTPKSNGIVNGNVELKTDHPKLPLLKVRFVGWVK
jgi:hypothetical protein